MSGDSEEDVIAVGARILAAATDENGVAVALIHGDDSPTSCNPYGFASRAIERRLGSSHLWSIRQKGPSECSGEKEMVPVLQWLEYEDIIWSDVLKAKTVANAYCIRKGLNRKADLAHFVGKWCRKRPNTILRDHVPLSVVLDISENEDELEWCLLDARDAIDDAAHACPESLWIIKPSVTNQGAGLHVVRTLDEIREVIKEESEFSQWVLQKYIDNPLLLNDRKFTCRVFVVAVGALKVFFFEEMYFLVATESYDRAEVDKVMSHITNFSVNKEHAAFCRDEAQLSLGELQSALEGQGLSDARDRIQKAIGTMKAIVGEVFKAVAGELGGFMPMPNCFELFGVDFLIDENFEPWLLEINCGPDLSCCEKLRATTQNLIESTIELALAELFLGSEGDRSIKETCLENFTQVLEVDLHSSAPPSMSLR